MTEGTKRPLRATNTGNDLERGLYVEAGSPPALARRTPDQELVAIAEAVAQARVRYAEAFIRFKMTGATDGLAHQQATVETDAELVVLEARLALAGRA